MINTLRRLGFAGIAALLVSPAAAQYHQTGYLGVPCGCGMYAPLPPTVRHVRPSYEGYFSQSQPAAAVGYSSAGARTEPLPSQYYTSEEADVLYHPVVVPLDEFLRPGLPVALTPEQLARQRAAAEARVAPPAPRPSAAPAAAAPEVDPFADDNAAKPATPADAASTAAPAEGATAEPAEEDTFAEEAMPVEQPEAEATPEAEAAPAAEPAETDEDPFNL